MFYQEYDYEDEDFDVVEAESALPPASGFVGICKGGRGQLALGKQKQGKYVPTNPDNYIDSEQRDFIRQLLGETFEAYSQQPVKNDQELVERLDEYFRKCATRGQLPVLEEMYMYTGHTIDAVMDYESGKRAGFSANTAKILRKARDYMKSFDAKMATSGKMPFLVYCFRSKNYYGMSDKQEIAVSAVNPLTDGNDPADALKALEGLPEVDEN